VLISNCGSNLYDYLSFTQLRIDFLAFSLSEPDATGFCVDDSLSVTDGASSVPLLCGENTSQHGKVPMHVLICPQEF
jgi:hypothetical protein